VKGSCHELTQGTVAAFGLGSGGTPENVVMLADVVA
jgi:hypothetical protein